MSRLSTLKPRVAVLNISRAAPPPKRVASIYQTPEYAAWRKLVIERAGGRCQGHGCGRTGTRLFADHRVELKDGGAPYDVANGQALCGSCHTRKTAAAKAARMRRG